MFEAIETAKRGLSDAERSDFTFDYPGILLRESLSREAFEEYTAEAVKSILARLDATLVASGLAATDVDLVCSTPGTARVRALADGIRDRFGEARMVRLRSLHSVIQGLGERARLLAA